MKATVIRILTTAVLIIITATALFYLEKAVPGFIAYFRYATAGLILLGGVFVSRELSRFISLEFKPELRKNAPVAGNAIKISLVFRWRRDPACPCHPGQARYGLAPLLVFLAGPDVGSRD
jgi:hypothetical protein